MLALEQQKKFAPRWRRREYPAGIVASVNTVYARIPSRSTCSCTAADGKIIGVNGAACLGQRVRRRCGALDRHQIACGPANIPVGQRCCGASRETERGRLDAVGNRGERVAISNSQRTRTAIIKCAVVS